MEKWIVRLAEWWMAAVIAAVTIPMLMALAYIFTYATFTEPHGWLIPIGGVASLFTVLSFVILQGRN